MAPATDDFGSDGFSPRSGTNRLNQSVGSDASPDSKCPICLDSFENVAYLNRCYHKFCFRCVQEWSKNKAECPLCKQPFHSIIHSMRSDDDFQEYIVRPLEHRSFASPDGRRFRYRTTLTRERRTSTYPRRNSSSRRTASPPDNGILFESFSAHPPRRRDAEMRQMIRRLSSLRQASLEGRSMRQIQEQDMINFRRALYRSGTRVRNIEDGGRYRDISAEFFRRNPACLHRLVPWLKRELTVLFGAHGSLVNIVQHIIMSNVTRYDLEGPAFADDLKPFLLHRTEHFLHEFISFARCPFNIEAYDQRANYDCPAPSYEEGSRSDSSIITISPDEADSRDPDRNALTTGTGQAPWDDETPGPSYSSAAEQASAAVSATLDSSESSDEEPLGDAAEPPPQLPASVETNGDSDGSSDNCVIVGYVKPLAERTPELVELSSDSEGSVDDSNKREEADKVKPAQYRSFSDTDASGYASPYSLGSRDGRSGLKADAPPSNQVTSKRHEKEKAKARESAPRNWLQSSAARRGGGSDSEDHRLSKRRKPESYSRHSHSRERRSVKSKRKRRSAEKRKRERDNGRHKHRRDKKKSRDESLSRDSQALSLSSESLVSRDLSRSRSRSNEYRRRRSKSKDSDYYLRDSYRSRYYYYERRRSRSRSSSRSRTPSLGSDRTRSEKPSGKRKYKTRHLESANRGGEEPSSTKEQDALPKPVPEHKNGYKRDVPTDADSYPKKRRRRWRSPSVEIVYEGKAADARHQKKKRRRGKRSRKSHAGGSAFSSPVVITIDSDSAKESENQGNMECDSTFSWSPIVPQRETESLCSLLDNQDCRFDGETESLYSPLETRDCRFDGTDDESLDKESNVPAAVGDAQDEVADEALQPRDTPNGHASDVPDDRAFETGIQPRKVDAELSNRLQAVRKSLLLRLSKKLLEHSRPRDSPDQKV